MKVLIFGGNSFTASHLDWPKEIKILRVSRHSKLNCDLGSVSSIISCIDYHKPEVVINFAAISVTTGFSRREFFETNFQIGANIINALTQSKWRPHKVIFPSSSHIYGNINCEQISEETQSLPVTPYGKVKQMLEDLIYFYSEDLNIITTRPFNYTGIGQRVENFFIPKVVNAATKQVKVLMIGNLEVKRDFSDVRDISRMYFELVVNDNRAKAYNFCSGRSYSLDFLVEEVQRLSGHRFTLKLDSNLARTNEVMVHGGDFKRFSDEFNFQHKFSIQDTISWMLGL